MDAKSNTNAAIVSILSYEITEYLFALEILIVHILLGFYRRRCVIKLNPYIALVISLDKDFVNKSIFGAHL